MSRPSPSLRPPPISPSPSSDGASPELTLTVIGVYDLPPLPVSSLTLTATNSSPTKGRRQKMGTGEPSQMRGASPGTAESGGEVR